jgi:hypothetical protein
MSPKKQQFTIKAEDLQKWTDVDDSSGRSVPTNMNYVAESFLTKDTGFELYGQSTSQKTHSLFHYKKKSGTSYTLRGKGTKLQSYNHKWAFTVGNIGTGSVVMANGNPIEENDTVIFGADGTLVTGIEAGSTYYAVNVESGSAFQVSDIASGSVINFTSNGTAIQYFNNTEAEWEDLPPTFTEDAEFGFYVYDDLLHGCNAVEDYFTFDGATFTDYASAPKGNIIENYEDRMFVAGVAENPRTVYYSNIGSGTSFTVTDLVQPLGTDDVTNLKNYYGFLLIFKEDSIWKLSFVYDQIVTLFLPKLEQQTGNYGSCSRKAVVWVENDLWFFTGREVRAIGFVDQQQGVLGINRSVISEPIKETLKLIDSDDWGKVATFYLNRRFYLGIPLDNTENDTIFVCHTLYKNSWTKYNDRYKANVNDFIRIEEEIYTNNSQEPYGTVKWNSSKNEINEQVIYKEIFDTDPDGRWRIGSDWSWSSGNENMEYNP